MVDCSSIPALWGAPPFPPNGQDYSMVERLDIRLRTNMDWVQPFQLSG